MVDNRYMNRKLLVTQGSMWVLSRILQQRLLVEKKVRISTKKRRDHRHQPLQNESHEAEVEVVMVATWEGWRSLHLHRHCAGAGVAAEDEVAAEALLLRQRTRPHLFYCLEMMKTVFTIFFALIKLL